MPETYCRSKLQSISSATGAHCGTTVYTFNKDCTVTCINCFIKCKSRFCTNRCFVHLNFATKLHHWSNIVQ